ncbi:hypothetical protein F7725_014903 [Dissostichus mawsoni]|uniref:Uncharacterized protein n=1 Tax=Dissostichus mawsoni TaxID=36200 RepID=A0A7J5YG03_DISMA|nr:hypothetical protein F7725_014903 [Dissostichus mawsoni]
MKLSDGPTDVHKAERSSCRLYVETSRSVALQREISPERRLNLDGLLRVGGESSESSEVGLVHIH